MTATAALLSAPRIASLAFSYPPSTSTGSISATGGTVSRWAQSMMLFGPGAGDPREQIARVGTSRRCGVVLGDLKPNRTELAGDVIDARALVARRALDPAQRNERVVQTRALGLGRAPHEVDSA